MNVNAEKLEGNKAKLTIEVPEETFEISMEKAFRQIANRLTVRGFRKGKAPRQVVERMYGREILLEDAINDAIPQAFNQAVGELGRQYECIVYPAYDVVSSEKGDGLVFTATYDLKPEISLGQYIGMEVERTTEDIDESAVEEQLKAMQERFARLDKTEGPAVMGDVCTMNFLGKIDDVPFEGGEGKEYPLELGSGTFIPGFEEQMVDACVGDELNIKVTFPEDYHTEELAGKDAVFEVSISDIQHKTLAEMDDEFAKDVSEFDTLDELRNNLEEKLIQEAKDKAQADFESRTVEKVIEQTDFELPESMIELRKDQLVENFANQITSQGLALELYLQYAQMTMDDLRENFTARAERELRTELILEAIAEAEHLTVEDADLDDEYERLSAQTGAAIEDVKAIYDGNEVMQDSMKFSIMMERTIKLLADSAIAIEAKPVETEDDAVIDVDVEEDALDVVIEDAVVEDTVIEDTAAEDVDTVLADDAEPVVEDDAVVPEDTVIEEED